MFYLIPLELTAWASATDPGIHKTMFGLGMTTLMISNKEINDTTKIVKSLDKSDLFTENVSETIKDEAKVQKGGFLGMLSGASCM